MIFILIGGFAFSQSKKKDAQKSPAVKTPTTGSQVKTDDGKKIEIRHAGLLRFDKGINAKRLIGNVICEHEGAFMN